MLKQIQPKTNLNAVAALPGSKSYSHRYLIAAALAGKPSLLRNMLQAQDIAVTTDILKALSIAVTTEEPLTMVYGKGGKLEPLRTLYAGDSGTSARFALALVALSGKPCVLDGSERMRQRPMGELVAALRSLGCNMETAPGDCLPVTMPGGVLSGGKVSLNCAKSSQFLSALLLIAPLLPYGLEIQIEGDLVSKAYVDMTIAVMQAFGISVETTDAGYKVNGGQTYRAGEFTIEPDASQASYFWAAAAVAKGRVLVKDVCFNTAQGDINFARLLGCMGCEVMEKSEGLEVACYGGLKAIEADMGLMPDVVPTLAVVAAFAGGTTVLHNVAHLQYKESDRIAAVIMELGKMGIRAWFDGASLSIEGGEPKGTAIATYNDHRMAMAFAVAGLGATGTVIEEAECVGKSFPNFWNVFESLA